MSESSEKKYYFPGQRFWLWLLFPTVLFVFFGTYHLSKFETADEHFWIQKDRIHKYWQAVNKREWKKTRINDKPGITLAYTAGIGYLFDDGSGQLPIGGEGVFKKYDPERAEKTALYYRLPLFLWCGLLTACLIWSVWKLTRSRHLTLAFGTLTLLSPILLGMSQVVNPDALSWVFCALVIFLYAGYVRQAERQLLYLAAIAFGLLLATKYIGTILFLILPLANMLWWFYGHGQEKNRDNLKAEVIRLTRGYFLIVFSGLVILMVLMPAAFKKFSYITDGIFHRNHLDLFLFPIMILQLILLADAYFLRSLCLERTFRTIRKAKPIILTAFPALLLVTVVLVALNWILGLNLWDLDRVPFNSRQSDFFATVPVWQKFILQFKPLVFSINPVVLILFVLGMSSAFRKDNPYRFELAFASFFILAYYAAVTYQSLLVTVRYGIIIYPVVFFVAAIGYEGLVRYKDWRRWPAEAFFFALLVILAGSLWLIRPYYLNYTNELLPNKYLISNAWGYGGYEAAQFLNAQPEADKMTIVSDYDGVCIFTRGYCVQLSNDVRGKVLERFKEGSRGFYFVLTRRGQERWGYIGEFRQFEGKAPLWELEIDGRPDNYVRVYRSE